MTFKSYKTLKTNINYQAGKLRLNKIVDIFRKKKNKIHVWVNTSSKKNEKY